MAELTVDTAHKVLDAARAKAARKKLKPLMERHARREVAIYCCASRSAQRERGGVMGVGDTGLPGLSRKDGSMLSLVVGTCILLSVVIVTAHAFDALRSGS